MSDKLVKVSDYILSFLAGKDIKHVFFLPGGGAMHLNDSIGKNKDIKGVSVLHEQSAAICAESYSRMTENFGAAILTSGPGTTNAITGVAAAWTDSIPCFFVSGQVKRSDLLGQQDLRISGYQRANIIDLVKPISKYACLIVDAEEIAYQLEKAYYLMKSDRPGPVWIDVPLDIQAATIDYGKLKHFKPSDLADNKKREFSGNDYDIKEIVSQIKKAKRPVILAGNGIRLAGGMRQFDRLIAKLNIPILTTWGAIDFIAEDHKMYFGRPNTLGGNRAASFIIQNADFVLAIGARLGVQQIGYNHEAFAREAKLVVVDVDKKELDKPTINPYLKVCSDARIFMEKILSELDSDESFTKKNRESKKELNWWINWCKERREKYPIITSEFYREKRFANCYALIDSLSDQLTSEDIIAPSSSGTSYVCICQAFRLKKGQRFLTSRGMASMGWGVPSAIGACLGGKGKRTICVTGDGSIQMNVQELQTIISNNLPIKIFMLNNEGYLTIKNTQKYIFDSNFVGCNPESGLKLPDMKKIAVAYGMPVYQIAGNNAIHSVVKDVLSNQGPAFCEVIMSSDQTIVPRLSSRLKADGKMVSSPLEDLFPFLERDEFLSNMLISPYEG